MQIEQKDKNDVKIGERTKSSSKIKLKDNEIILPDT